jgi:hypothetical protein
VITCASAATILADSQGQPGWMSRGRIEGHEIASPAPVINTPRTVGSVVATSTSSASSAIASSVSELRVAA